MQQGLDFMLPSAVLYRTGQTGFTGFPKASTQPVDEVLEVAMVRCRQMSAELRACAILWSFGTPEMEAFLIKGDHLGSPPFEIVVEWSQAPDGSISTIPTPSVRPGDWAIFSPEQRTKVG